MRKRAFITWAVAALTLLSGVALAQQQPQPQPQAQPQPQPATSWEKLPRGQLEMSFAGPLRDTAIARWRDTSENVICYLYLPILAQGSPAGPTGYVTYGANQIGTISCVPGLAPVSQPKAAAPPAKGTKNTPRETSHPQPAHTEPTAPDE